MSKPEQEGWISSHPMTREAAPRLESLNPVVLSVQNGDLCFSIHSHDITAAKVITVTAQPETAISTAAIGTSEFCCCQYLQRTRFRMSPLLCHREEA